MNAERPLLFSAFAAATLFFLVLLFCSSKGGGGSNVKAGILKRPSDAQVRSLASRLDGWLSLSGNEDAAKDFGNMYSYPPAAVLHPKSKGDIVAAVKHALDVGWWKIAAVGHSHSVQGQAQSPQGLVIRMAELRGIYVHGDGDGPEGAYVEAHAGELWIDVLRESVKHGLSPISWTDYLYLTVGGTLSHAGVSGQAFRYGPQIANVFQLQIITGKGEVLNCSKGENADLFFAALGGLGQFGIITTAKIALQPSPDMVKWVRVLYSDFESFIADQQRLVSGHDSNHTFDYVEGFVIINKDDLLSNWRSSIFRQQNPRSTLDDLNLVTKGRIFYCLEAALYYSHTHAELDKDLKKLLDGLRFIPATMFTADVTYVEFLDRVHAGELKLRAQGLWEVPHPWLNLFIPASKISVFDQKIFKGLLRNSSSDGPVLVYPMNRTKWDERTSAVIPDEEIFYLVAFLRSSIPNDQRNLERILKENQVITRIAEKPSIGGKQYLPHYRSEDGWKKHFGEKWHEFVRRKKEYDPCMLLSPGHRIFEKPLPSYSMS